MVWTDATEVRQAVEILPLWVDIDVDDALELLGKEFGNRAVRSYAVNQLRKADDDVSKPGYGLQMAYHNSHWYNDRIYYYTYCSLCKH